MAKPTKPKILKVVRTDSFVEIVREVAKSSEQTQANNPDKPGEKVTKVVTSSSEFKEKAHEAPLPAFDEALQALAPVAAKVLGCDPSWREGVNITGLAVTYTENGTRSAQIILIKSLLDGTILHPMKTPSFRIDDDKSGKSGRREVTPKHAEAVTDMIKQAQRYSDGERSQQLLKFADDSDDENTNPNNVEKLPGLDNGDE